MPRASRRTAKNTGFTLVEVTIVLMIIGLIIAAITVGQTLVRQSQINSVITDWQKYTAAIKNFQQKYGAMPGDFSNAQGFWGASSYCNTTTAPTGTLTCNGGGNGQVGNKMAGTNMIETLWAWQHLADAGMINGSYTGTDTSTGTSYYSVPGVNVPASKLPGAGYSFMYVGAVAADGTNNWFAANYGHVIEFGGVDPTYYLETWTGIITPDEAHGIDSKIDDGLPGMGNVMTYGNSAESCANGNTHTTAIYETGSAGYTCSLVYLTGM